MRTGQIKISASLLAADFGRLADSVREAEDAGCDELHFDVMDGHFVPNITFGPAVLEAVRKVTGLPIDVHMMVTEPARYVREFADAGGTTFTVHVEACEDVEATLAEVETTGMQRAVSIKPGTPVRAISNLLHRTPRVLVMTVEPGFGGQPFMPDTLPKVVELRRLADQGGLELEVGVDGGINVDTARQAVDAGARTLVSGSGLFGHPAGMREAVRLMRGV